MAVMGLVTAEDLEEIVSDIRDEHDLAVQGVRLARRVGAGRRRRAGPDLNRVMAWDLPDEKRQRSRAS
jgi:Mg2+/Co2+ transporter CorB